MPRNMSFMLTVEQIRNQTKTVTRRQGWTFLKKGDILNACVKCMGLKKGEKVEKICQIKVKSVRRERILSITKEDCILEGFPDYSIDDFIDMYCTHNKVGWTDLCTRIEFEYVRESKRKCPTGIIPTEIKCRDI